MVKFERNRKDTESAVIKAKEYLNNSSGKYNSREVVEALRLIFHNKCYVCENKYPTEYNIEHLIPHHNNIELKIKWENLFLVCSHCNGIKSDKYYEIIDCTVSDPDKVISFEYIADIFNPDEKNVIIKALDENIKTLKTVELLNDIYYGHTYLKQMSAKNIRLCLHNEIVEFKKCLQSYKKHIINNDTIAAEDDVCIIHEQLKCSSEFAAFKRWYIIDNKDIYSEFYKYLMDKIYA